MSGTAEGLVVIEGPPVWRCNLDVNNFDFDYLTLVNLDDDYALGPMAHAVGRRTEAVRISREIPQVSGYAEGRESEFGDDEAASELEACCLRRKRVGVRLSFCKSFVKR
jgi:hypothetical protein